MVFEKVGKPLQLKEVPIPTPREGQALIKVHACAVCRTDLHIIDGELKEPKLPLILGHQIVGTIEGTGKRVGVPWLGGSCGMCPYCLEGQENLCDSTVLTGYNVDGGFAEYCVARKDFCFPIPEGFDDVQAAPLLCGGLIGFRTLRMAQDAKRLGFYGFGSAAHMLIQIARYQHQEVYAFTRKGDEKTQKFARSLGAVWAGGSDEKPPIPLDAALIFAPQGSLIPLALQAVRKGGSVICAGIHMSAIPSFSYDLLYGERILRSVTNLTRQDGRDLLSLAPKIPIHTKITTYPLASLNQALSDLRSGKLTGTAVISI